MSIERLHTGTPEWIEYFGNHIVRYQFAVDQVKEKLVENVLDVACGVGYGSHYMADSLSDSLVKGVDISFAAIEEAKRVYGHNRVSFYLADAVNLPAHITKIKYDLIVSLETLEHLNSQELFLENICAILKPGGVFIVSTPNVDVTGHHEEGSQEFHIKEYNLEEFRAALSGAGFNSCVLYGQYYSDEGLLRNEMRNELNLLRGTILVRLSFLLEKWIKKRKYLPVLPEKESDFEIKKIGNNFSDKNQPFVFIAVCQVSHFP